MASLISAPTPSQDSACPQKTTSFAALWFEELQRSRDALNPAPDTQRDDKLPVKDPIIQTSPVLQLSKVASSDSCVSEQLESEGQDCVMTQTRTGDTSETNEDDPSNELKLLQDLKLFLFTASSNLCRSIMASSTAHKSGKEVFLPCDEKPHVIPGYGLAMELDSNVCALAASASSSMNVPKLLKGGAPQGENAFEWRLDIEEKDVDTTPLNTPVRNRSPTHLCRGVQFQYEEHPPALSLIELDPGLGYGWRGPDWQDTHGKYSVYKVEGPSIYGRCRPNNTPFPGVTEYYKSIEVETMTRWETIKSRYRKASQLAQIRAKLREDIRESEDWRKHLVTLISESSSESEESEADKRRRLHEKRELKIRRGESDYEDPDRVRSLLSSSSSSIDSDDSMKAKLEVNPRCKRKHTHCYPGTYAPRGRTSTP
nr:uncharacterized protein LOC112286312 [Physcomitrium patens]|eukprot:XP_024383830.1 uncharacterized protein LOC112286312 [Physcomitrella patens]